MHAVRACVDDLLAVVEDQQRSPIPHHSFRRPRAPTRRSRLSRRSPRRYARHQRSVREWSQIYKPDPVVMLVDLTGGHLERNSRLPRPARPGQSHEAGLAQQLGDSPHRLLASNEHVHRRRQVVASSREEPATPGTKIQCHRHAARTAVPAVQNPSGCSGPVRQGCTEVGASIQAKTLSSETSTCPPCAPSQIRATTSADASAA